MLMDQMEDRELVNQFEEVKQLNQQIKGQLERAETEHRDILARMQMFQGLRQVVTEDGKVFQCTFQSIDSKLLDVKQLKDECAKVEQLVLLSRQNIQELDHEIAQQMHHVHVLQREQNRNFDIKTQLECRAVQAEVEAKK